MMGKPSPPLESSTMKGVSSTESPPLSPALVIAFRLPVLLVLLAIPWWLHFTLGWWAGLLSWLCSVWVYDFLFVPRNSLGMGIPFMLVLCNFLALLILDIALLSKWVFG